IRRGQLCPRLRGNVVPVDDILAVRPMVKNSPSLIDGAVIVSVEKRKTRQPGWPRQTSPRAISGGIGNKLRTLRGEMIRADQKRLLAIGVPYHVIGVHSEHPTRTVEVVEARGDVGRHKLSP